jgi:hypothetical protein
MVWSLQLKKNEMKKRFKDIFALLFLCNITIWAQSQNNFKNTIVLGANAIDDSFTLKKIIFNLEEEWNIALYPSYFSFAREIAPKYNLEVGITHNQYSKGKLVDVVYITKDKSYLAIDLNLKHVLLSLIY